MKKHTGLEAYEEFIDVCLTRVGCIWQNRIYALPIIHILYFELSTVHFEMINLVNALRL